MLVHDVNMADDPTVDVTAMLHSLPVEVQTLFSKLRKTWMEKVRARVCTCTNNSVRLRAGTDVSDFVADVA